MDGTSPEKKECLHDSQLLPRQVVVVCGECRSPRFDVYQHVGERVRRDVERTTRPEEQPGSKNPVETRQNDIRPDGSREVPYPGLERRLAAWSRIAGA